MSKLFALFFGSAFSGFVDTILAVFRYVLVAFLKVFLLLLIGKYVVGIAIGYVVNYFNVFVVSLTDSTLLTTLLGLLAGIGIFDYVKIIMAAYLLAFFHKQILKAVS